MYLDTGDLELQEHYQSLLQKVIEMFDHNSAFGFCDLYKSSHSIRTLVFVGLLDGVTGIVMTLLDVLESPYEPQKRDWGICLLIQ